MGAIEWYLGKKKEIDNNARRALEQTAAAIIDDLIKTEVLPWAEDSDENRQRGVIPGELQGSVFVDRTHSIYGEVSVVTNTPYARRLYYNPDFNFYQGENYAAGGEWYEQYKAGKGAKWVAETYRKLLKGLMG